MSDSSSSDSELSAEAGAIIDRWMQQQPGLRPTKPAEPTVVDLVAYLARSNGTEFSRTIETALTRSPMSRGLLIDVNTTLARIRASTWVEADAIAAEGGLAGEVARAWLGIVQERVPLVASAASSAISPTWQAARDAARSTGAEVQSVWTAIVSSTRMWAATLRPAGFALARGAEDNAAEVIGLDPGVRAIVTAEILADLTLTVTLELTFDRTAPGVRHKSAELHLKSSTNSRTPFGASRAIRIGTAQIVEGRAEWSQPGFGRAAGCVPGLLPDRCVRILLDGSNAPPPNNRVQVAVIPVDRQGQTLPETSTIHAEFDGPIRIEGGVFSASIQIVDEDVAQWFDRLLVAETIVTSACSQRIGTWSVRELAFGSHQISAHCPGVADVVGDPTILRLLLQPAEQLTS